MMGNDITEAIGQVEMDAIMLNTKMEELLLRSDRFSRGQVLQNRDLWLKQINRIRWLMNTAKEKVTNWEAYMDESLEADAVEEI